MTVDIPVRNLIMSGKVHSGRTFWLTLAQHHHAPYSTVCGNLTNYACPECGEEESGCIFIDSRRGSSHPTAVGHRHHFVDDPENWSCVAWEYDEADTMYVVHLNCRTCKTVSKITWDIRDGIVRKAL